MAFLIPAIGGIAAGAGTVGAIGTTGAVATGLGTAALLGQGVSSYQQGQYNQDVMNQQAQATLIAQQQNEAIQGRQMESNLSRNRAMVGASGIEFTGSPLDVEINNLYEYEEELRAQRYNANVSASQARSKGNLASMQGSAVLGTSLFKAGAFTAGNLLE